MLGTFGLSKKRVKIYLSTLKSEELFAPSVEMQNSWVEKLMWWSLRVMLPSKVDATRVFECTEATTNLFLSLLIN